MTKKPVSVKSRMDRFVKHTKIKNKMFVGFGLMIALLLAVESLAVYKLGSIDGYFKQYRVEARQTNQLGRVQANLLLTRLYAKDYIMKNTEEAAEAMDRRIRLSETLLEESEEMFISQHDLDGLKELEAGVRYYRKNFDEVHRQVTSRNELVNQLNQLGPEIEQTLTQIMQETYKNQNPSASYLTGMSLRGLLLARLYSNRFLVDNLASNAERAKQELETFGDSMAAMAAKLGNAKLQKLASEAIVKELAYKNAFEQVVDVINQRNAIIKDRLDVKGVAMADLSEDMKLENKTMQDSLGPMVERKTQQAFMMTGVTSLLAILLAVMLANVLGKAISNPVVDMTGAMGNLSEGKLDVTVPAVDHKDEMGDMARALEVFKLNAIKVQEKDREVARLNEEQKAREIQAKKEQQQALTELAETFDNQIGEMLQDLVASSEVMKNTSVKMKDIAFNTLDSSETMASASEESNSNVANVVLAMHEINTSTTDIADQMVTTQQKSRETSAHLVDAKETFTQLDSRIQSIGLFVESIRAITNQTNLLALNATIESAQAGDAGRGFGIVADEVKNLAVATAEKTTEINERVEEIQAFSKNAINDVNLILKTIEEIDGAIINVSSSIEEQSVMSDEINRNVNNASRSSELVSEIIKEVKQGAEETGTSCESVLNQVDQVTRRSKDLQDAIRGFLDHIRESNQDDTADRNIRLVENVA